MARKTARPGRTLGAFFLVLALVYVLVAVGGRWKPQLGLDLEGGTQISMQAHNPGGGSVPSSALNQARDIIDQRVNGTGITSATVTTEGGDIIQVSIPGSGSTQQDLANRVRQTAKLAFRMVACGPSGGGASRCTAGASTSGSTSGSSAPRALPSFALKKPTTSKASSAKATAKPSATASHAAATPVATGASASPTASTSASPSATTSGTTGSTGTSSCVTSKAQLAKLSPTELAQPVSVTCATDFMKNPPTEWQEAYNKFTCPAPGSNGEVEVNVGTTANANRNPLVTCDSSGNKYLLSPAVIDGSGISDASYAQPQNQTAYVVTLSFKGSDNVSGEETHPSADFADATGAIACDSTSSSTCDSFAIVLDGNVLSAPTASSRITGQAQITGGQNADGSTGFSLTDAKSLANNLKYGSLPLEFPASGISTETVGPSLAGNQLSAGLWAGAIGLLLVMIYCLIYYRGLGLVVIGSLVVAGASTYGLVVLLSKTAGVTLDLPGIAGLIVAVGITADSFIVYFERIRDEMREGKSMRVAVDAGWIRARNTCLAADSVSLLASITLYIFATSDVRGFAFMLGMSTVIDLIIFFFFTHPLVKLLSGLRFFNRGHKLSGLDREALGVKRSGILGGKA